MPVALLDHPWPLDAGLEPGSPAVGVLLGYENLLRRYLLRPARFVTTDEYQELMQNLGTRRGGGRQDIIRLAHQLLRIEEDGPLATPEPEPRPPLSESWKRALRAEIEGDEGWRSPQIVFPRVRQDVWPNSSELDIRCSDRTHLDVRVLVCMEEYASHRYAIGDGDPWRHLEHRHPPDSSRIKHPCILPKPTALRMVALRDVGGKLQEVGRRGWHADGRYSYVPAADYDALGVSRDDWRRGRAFVLGRAEGRERSGPIDHAGRIWEWHGNERHWDVQLPGGGYRRISHDGRDLDEA